jgi:hypothetical protein
LKLTDVSEAIHRPDNEGSTGLYKVGQHQRITWLYIPEDSKLHIRLNENLKSRMEQKFVFHRNWFLFAYELFFPSSMVLQSLKGPWLPHTREVLIQIDDVRTLFDG